MSVGLACKQRNKTHANLAKPQVFIQLYERVSFLIIKNTTKIRFLLSNSGKNKVRNKTCMQPLGDNII